MLTITIGLARLKPAALTANRSSIWIDTVKRGPMLRQVRGTGSLIPESVRVIAASTEGRIERIFVQPGVEVSANTMLAELSNPELAQAAQAAEYQLLAAEADYKNLQVRLESDRMSQQSAAATVHADYQHAKLQFDTDATNGIIPGRVVRIDPAVREGTVTVDVALERQLPQGARPDLSVDGTIELERLSNVLYMGRPAFGQGQNSAVNLFKLEPDGQTATRIQVKLGRSSVNAVEVLEGLAEGDQVILSDTSAWDTTDHISLK